MKCRIYIHKYIIILLLLLYTPLSANLDEDTSSLSNLASSLNINNLLAIIIKLSSPNRFLDRFRVRIFEVGRT